MFMRLPIALLVLCLCGCSDEGSSGSPGHETALNLRRADGAGGAVAVGARARMSLAATPCLTENCTMPRVEGPLVVTFTGAAAEVLGDPVIDAGAATFEVMASASGATTIEVSTPTQSGERTATFTVDFVDVATVTTTPICASELGGQEPLENRLATRFAMAADTSMELEVELRDAGGTLLTGYGLDALTVGDGFTLTAPPDEAGNVVLAAITVGDADIGPILGSGNAFGVRAYSFDQVDGFLWITQVGDDEAAFVGERSAPVGDVIRVEVLPTIRADLGCTLPFDAKYAVTTPETCTLEGDGVVATRWASVTGEAEGTCTVSVALTNANGRGHTATLDIALR
jgi:hypothetical protein